MENSASFNIIRDFFMTKDFSPFSVYLLINKLHASKEVKVVSYVYGHQVAGLIYLNKKES